MQPPRCGEQRPGGRAGAHGAGEVDVEHVGEHGRVVLGLAADDAGAVDQDVEPGEAGESGLRPRHRR